MKTALFCTLLSALLLMPYVHIGQTADRNNDNAITLIRDFQATTCCENAAACKQKAAANNHTPPELSFADPFLKNGDTLWVECNVLAADMGLPTFDEGAVYTKSTCPGDVMVNFKKTQISKGFGEPGILKLYRLSWVAVDGRGRTDSVHISLALIDTIAPRIHGVPQKTTGYTYVMPAPFANVFASDECQCELVLTVEDTLLNPGSLNGQVILRSWTAIDQSGNMTIVTQTFTLMNETSPYFLISQH